MSAGPTMDELIDELRANGHRVTTARRAVLQEVLDAGDRHLSAEDLAELIRRRQPDVHLSTVYRTVEVLESAGILTQVRVGHGPGTYHLAQDRHHHAVCDSCGQVVEVSATLLTSVVDQLDRQIGFAARPRHLTIDGTCARCRRNLAS